MEQLTKEQAFDIVKAALDAAVKGGIFPNLNTVIAVNNAFAILVQPENKENAIGHAEN
jgi:hypothetical protein